MLYAAPLAGEQDQASVPVIAFLNVPIEIIIGIVLWLQLKKAPEQVITDFPKPIQL